MSYGSQNDGVKANSGWSGDRNGPKTDFIITQPGVPDHHRHIAIDERGETVTDHYRRNTANQRGADARFLHQERPQYQVPPTAGNPNGYDQSRY